MNTPTTHPFDGQLQHGAPRIADGNGKMAHPLQALPNQQNIPTRQGQSPRAIDHIAYWGSTPLSNIPSPRVLLEWDLSDHFPVIVRLQHLAIHRLPPPLPDKQLSRQKWILLTKPEHRLHKSVSNCFEALEAMYGELPCICFGLLSIILHSIQLIPRQYGPQNHQQRAT